MSYGSLSSKPAFRRTGLALHLAAVLFLLLGQLSFAGHYHDDVSERSVHDCSLCLQLHNVKHGASSGSASESSHPLFSYQSTPHTQVAPSSFDAHLPPCRAPPRF